jgi:hypothetical protein
MNIDRYINDGQDPKVVEKILLKLQDMLASTSEDITYIAVQKKPGLTLFPDSIALTAERIFLCKSTKLGLATDFEILRWNSTQDISFKEGILGAKVTLTPIHGEPLEMGSIPKNQARKLYQLGTDALKASLAGQQMKHEDGPSTLQIAEPADELTLRLERLKSLFERQLITQVEYDNKKNELLSQL